MTPIELRPGDPSDACDKCDTLALPIVRIGIYGDSFEVYRLCVLCLADGIDLVTDWRFANNVLANLAVSPAAHNFRHPEAQVKTRRRRLQKGHG